MSRFRFVEDHRDTYRVKRLCELAEVSRPAFYKWRNRLADPGRRARCDAVLLEQIRAIHTESRCTYGAPRVHGLLRRRGVRIGRKRVARLMRSHGLVGVHGRRTWRPGKKGAAPTADLLERDFTATTPDTRCVADLTEFTTNEGRYYLAGIKDLCTRELVGWSMSERRTADIVVDALVMALGRRTSVEEVIHHADHGS